MASQQQARKPSAKGHEEERGQQGQAMNLEEIGKYRAEAQQRSADAIRAAEERFNRANQQRQHEGQGRAHGTVVALQEGTKPHPPAKQQHEEGEGHVGQESEAKQWLAETASDARERCNRAMGVGANPTAGQGDKGRHQSYATAASRGKEEGGQGQLLTRQAEMGHGREAQHKALRDAEAAVEKHDKKGKQQQQPQSGKDTAEHVTAKGAEAKDAGVRGAKATAEKAQETTQQATGTAIDYTKQAASKTKDATASTAGTTAEYAKQAAAKTKDVTASAAGTTAEYAKAAAVKAKDATASTGGTAAEYAKAAAEKAKEAAVATARTTAGYTQTAAVKAKDAAVATGAQVAQKATEVTAVAAERVAGFAREKAQQGKEAAARAEEPGDDVAAKTAAQKDSTADEARDVAGRYRRDDTAGGAAVGNKVKDAVAQKASDTVWRVKDTAKDAAGGVAQRTRDTASQVGRKAGEATQRAKGGHGEEEGGGGTTIVGDVLEAVGATVVGLAQHTKGIVAGEEEVVPGDVVETAKEKVAGAKEETKRKTA
ncbi:hypothetical protein PR202_ga07073 [Eleusine coracana subsp. coracana]|uniref:Uncharacterized protein n=1 Tax=Eleusine coracana subsp. coracana TaxID=191504 RepID=A0AAV5BWM0_ELECO|nr:hypothetical protein PR202_ga07073 [Eleusine coracana subsp. coracana]